MLAQIGGQVPHATEDRVADVAEAAGERFGRPPVEHVAPKHEVAVAADQVDPEGQDLIGRRVEEGAEVDLVRSGRGIGPEHDVGGEDRLQLGTGRPVGGEELLGHGLEQLPGAHRHGGVGPGHGHPPVVNRDRSRRDLSE